MSKNMFDDLASASANRERFVTKLNTAADLMGGRGSPGEAVSDTDILNFALNLEYLEAEFYTYVEEGKSITSFGIGINGKANGDNPASGGHDRRLKGRFRQRRNVQPRYRCCDRRGRTRSRYPAAECSRLGRSGLQEESAVLNRSIDANLLHD
jgi:hypothetical protein